VIVDGTLVDFENELKEFTEDQKITLTDNTDLIQLDIQQKKLTKALQLQRTQRMPTLAGFGQYGYTGSNTKEVTMNMEMGGQKVPISMPARNDLFSNGMILGLQLSVPIFSGGTNIIKEKQLKIQAMELDMQKEYLENVLNMQAIAALDNMKKAVEQVQSNKDNVRLSQKGYDISQKRYETGMGTMLELHGAALALTQSRLSYNQSVSDYLNAKAEFEKIVGL